MGETPTHYDTGYDSEASPLHLRGGYWFRVSANFMKYYAPRLPPIALNVYIYLCYRANDYSVCWPSVNRMARDLNLSRSSIQRALKTLVRARLVLYQHRFGATTGGPRSNFYLVCPALPPVDAPASGHTDVDDAGDAEGEGSDAMSAGDG